MLRLSFEDGGTDTDHREMSRPARKELLSARLWRGDARASWRSRATTPSTREVGVCCVWSRVMSGLRWHVNVCCTLVFIWRIARNLASASTPRPQNRLPRVRHRLPGLQPRSTPPRTPTISWATTIKRYKYIGIYTSSIQEDVHSQPMRLLYFRSASLSHPLGSPRAAPQPCQQRYPRLEPGQDGRPAAAPCPNRAQRRSGGSPSTP